MPRQVQQNASRCHWIVWLSTVVVLTSLTSAKTIASSQHPLSANFNGEEVKRQLRTADAGTVTGLEDSELEDRAFSIPLPDHLVETFTPSAVEKIKQNTEWDAAMLAHKLNPTIADQEFDKLRVINQPIDSNEFKTWWRTVIRRYDRDIAKSMDAIFTTLRTQYGETKLRKMLNDATKVSKENRFFFNAQFSYWTRHGANDDDIMVKMLKLDEDGNNILTDSKLVENWVINADVENPYELLFTILEKHLDERQYTEYVVIQSTDYSNIELQSQAFLLRKDMIAGWKHDQMTLDDVYTLLRFDEKPGPLKSPALSMWAHYARSKGEIPESLLFAKLQNIYKDEAALARAIIAAKRTLTKSLAEGLQKQLFEKWQANGKAPDEVDKLLRPDGSEDENIQRAFLAASKSYKIKHDEAA